MNQKYFSLFLLALSLVTLSLVGDILYHAPAQFAAIAPTTVRVASPTQNISRPQQAAVKSQVRQGILIVKLTREKAVEIFPILLKRPTDAKTLSMFKKYTGTVNAPTWGRPLYRFKVGSKVGAIPRDLVSNKFLQDLAGYIMVGFKPGADISSLTKELSDNQSVVYVSQNTMPELNPTITVAVSDTTVAGGLPICSGRECCEDTCWASWEDNVKNCEDLLSHGTINLDEYYLCLSIQQGRYMDCKTSCTSSPSPTPPSSPPSSGGGFGGTSPGRLFQNVPECDSSNPLIDCLPGGGELLP